MPVSPPIHRDHIDYIIDVELFQEHRREIRQDPGDKSHDHSCPETAVGRQSGYGDQSAENSVEQRNQISSIAFQKQVAAKCSQGSVSCSHTGVQEYF